MICRRLALVLTALLLFILLPVTAVAATPSEKDALIASAAESYSKSKAVAGVESFNGRCGKMVSHQIWQLGINKSLYSQDGNKLFDYYRNMEKTTGGYYIRPYPSQEYTLEQALQEITRNGTRDVYNLLVGFERTNTEAGAFFGHAVFVNGILDGEVYFVESYTTGLGVREGTVIVLTIPEFVAKYSSWTSFDGVIWFDKQGYAHTCQEYGTDIIVRTRFGVQLRSLPDLVGQGGCIELRSVAAGERLHVTAVLETRDGEMYYRVKDGSRVGYITAQSAVLERTNAEELYITDFAMEASEGSSRLQLSGGIGAANGLVGAVELVITDEKNQVVLRQRQITDSYQVALEDVSRDLKLEEPEDGRYTLSVYGETASAYVQEGALDYSYAKLLLQQQDFWVGQAEKPQTTRQEAPQEKLSGWYWRDNTWYYYKNNKPKTGWVQQMGIRYYIQKDGSVATSWQTINGQRYYFAANGAMAVGWLRVGNGTRYAFADGTFATGWQTIENDLYYFNNDIMQVQGKRVLDGVVYQFHEDGRATPVPEETK